MPLDERAQKSVLNALSEALDEIGPERKQSVLVKAHRLLLEDPDLPQVPWAQGSAYQAALDVLVQLGLKVPPGTLYRGK